MARARRPATKRDYPRSARLKELLREILAEELERVDDERVELVTVTGVDVDSDLRHAVVYFDCIDGEEGDAEVLEALGELRVRLQAAIGREARVRRVPTLNFRPDPAVRGGARIDAVLRDLHGDEDGAGQDADGTGGGDELEAGTDVGDVGGSPDDSADDEG